MPSFRNIPPRKRIALVAHDNRKAELADWAYVNREILSQNELFATGTTGKLMEETLGQPVIRLLSGPLGGDQQVGSMIAEERLDMLIFFWDPMSAQPHDPDVKALLRLCVVWNIPVASNRATADFLFASPLMNENYIATQIDYDNYLNRKV
jgi:methylglyoxal synthase